MDGDQIPTPSPLKKYRSIQTLILFERQDASVSVLIEFSNSRERETDFLVL